MIDSKSAPLASLAGDNTVAISAFGREWRLKQAANLEELWASMGEDSFEDERIPYWTELWPASLVLGQWLYLAQTEIRDELCLDLGCGLGFTAMIGKWLGAKLLACDYEMSALFNAKANAGMNGIAQPDWLAMDWRAPAIAPDSLARIWAGDIMYEKRNVLPVLALLDYCLAPGGAVWIAEPGRAIFNDFLRFARERNWKFNKVFSQNIRHWYPQEASITVAVCEARR